MTTEFLILDCDGVSIGSEPVASGTTLVGSTHGISGAAAADVEATGLIDPADPRTGQHKALLAVSPPARKPAVATAG